MTEASGAIGNPAGEVGAGLVASLAHPGGNLTGLSIDTGDEFLGKRLVKAELFLPWSAQQLRGELFSVCQVLEERADADGAHFSVRSERRDLEVLREHIAQATGTPERDQS